MKLIGTKSHCFIYRVAVMYGQTIGLNIPTISQKTEAGQITLTVLELYYLFYWYKTGESIESCHISPGPTVDCVMRAVIDRWQQWLECWSVGVRQRNCFSV